MNELNCSYEESKKIFDLGYDFSKVCDFAWVTMNTNETPVLVCQNLEIQYLLFTQKIYDFQTALIQKQPIEIIPIIPKAALEACLPDINPSNDERLPDLDICRLRVSKYHTDMCDREHEEIIREFSSAFEAFTWCHENYPKELKKKFKEVMG